MGDGSLAFAPQWLKAGHTSLRSGTQGGASTTKEDSSKGTPWRESGSRLGLGAGADREPSEPKQSSIQSRRQGNSYQDRQGANHSRGDRALGNRTPNQNRILSDRELVEQTSSLKLRPGRGALDQDNFSSFKDSYTPRGTSAKGPPRKGTGAQRNGNLRANDHEISSQLRSPSAQPLLSPPRALLSPRQDLKSPPTSLASPLQTNSVTEHPWSTRLADTPHEVPRALQSTPAVEGLRALTQESGKSNPLPIPATSSISEQNVRSTPRMVDAILQGQAAAAQELEAAKAEKARKEQLALRQSKQLVPVLAATKPKQSLGTLGGPTSSMPSLRRTPGINSAGVEAPKANATAFITTTRRDDESVNGMRKAPKPLDGQAVQNQNSKGSVKPLVRRPSKDKDRLSFFSSLRKTSSVDAHAESETSSQLSQEGSLGSRAGGTQAETSEADRETERHAESRMNESGLTRQAKSAEPELLAQEVAFMKSLGWDGDVEGDDAEEGGLTEEEIAAFHANKARQSFSTPVSIPAKGSGNVNGKPDTGLTPSKKAAKQVSAHSFHSEMEFSDSETE